MTDTAANEPRVKLVFDLVCTTCLSAVHCDSRHDLLDWLWAHAHEVEVDDPPLDL